MRERIVLALVLTGLFACATGCKKQVDHAEFISAINKSFVGRHECVWAEPVKLPAQSTPPKTKESAPSKASPMLAFCFVSLRKRSTLSSTPNRSIPTTSPTRDTPPGPPRPTSPVTATSASATSTPPPSKMPPPTTPPTLRNTPSITVTKF
jgi:hypothetical protein